jgi:hypothetical protein
MASGDPTDPEGELVGPLLPPERGRPGRPGHDRQPAGPGRHPVAGARGGRPRAIDPEAVPQVGHGPAPVRALARPGRACSRRCSPPWPRAARPRSACRCSTAPRAAPTSTPPAPRGAARPSLGPLAWGLLDQAAPALRRPRPAARARPHARRGARDPRLRGLGRGARGRHALPDRRHGPRRGLAAAGAAAARRPPGAPAPPGAPGAGPARPRASSTGCATASSGW